LEFYLQTERLLLRHFRLSDVQALYNMDSLPEVHQYLGGQPLTDIAKAEQVIKMVIEQYHVNGIGRWMVEERATGQVIGWAGLKYITTQENNESNFYDVGYRLHPNYWGKGYATESAKAAIDYGFTHFNMSKIVGTCHVNNGASRRVLEKCGLIYTASYKYDDLPCDWLEISRDKWNRIKVEN